MALKSLITQAEYDKLPDALKSEYSKSGEQYVLEVDGADYKSKLDEFRSNNIKLQKAKEELVQSMERFKGVDPEKYAKALEAFEKIEALEDKELLKAGKIDDIIMKRTGVMQEEHKKALSAAQKTIETLQGQTSTYQKKLGGLLVETTIGKAVNAIGVPRQSALPDIYNRANQAFMVDPEGALKPADGLFNGKGEPITPEDWAKKLLEEAPHLFEAAGGGGAKGNANKGGGGSGQKIIANDPLEFGRNLEGIAKGTVTVQGH